jgi:hypothetical protein
VLHELDGRAIKGTVRFSNRPSPRLAPHAAPTYGSIDRTTGRFIIWLCLIGALIPAADIVFYVAGAKFTVGRLAVAALLFPAVITMARGRKLLTADVLAVALGSWMLIAAIDVGGRATISSAGAEGLEFVAGYFAARAFIYGPVALSDFAGALKVVLLVVILMATAEHATGRLIVHEMFASIFHTIPPDAQFRNGSIRAMATFDHAILFGAFCAFCGMIFLYANPNSFKRALWVGLAAYGCLLSLSSSAVMAIVLAVMIYIFDRAMRRYPWRWSLLWGLAIVPLLGLSAVSQHPLHWIISHLTYDPVSGFFRLMIWDAAFEKIGQSPLVGYGFHLLGNDILDATVDSVWLVYALRFGLPAVALLILASMAAWRAVPHKPSGHPVIVVMERMSTGFTMVLGMFMFVGLTVHFWNYMWIFWGICIGTRASVREWFLTYAR